MLLWIDGVHWSISLFLHICGIIAAVHALLTKRDPRAALGWMLLSLLIPFGFLLYLIFGINRVKAVVTHWESRGFHDLRQVDPRLEVAGDTFEHALYQLKAFRDLQATGDHICKGRVMSGCAITVLHDGTQAYPEMIAAIQAAKSSVYLSTYIFGTGAVGEQFVEALSAAEQRGVEVKVLIDGVGALYSWPTAYRKLKRRGVTVALYLPPFGGWYQFIHMNLRNHRKILVVDGTLGFTGGMNIHSENVSVGGHAPKIHDLHFRVEGPIVGFLQDVFLKAWYFSVKGSEVKKVVYYDNSPKGTALCRGIASGPHHALPQIERILCAAINAASRTIRIMTPYFIAGPLISSALASASLRGVVVEIVLPESNNLSFVKGASEAILPGLLQYGVRFFYRRGNFAHTKLFIVDDFCALIGSSNVDIRSLYLNFEFNLEIYDAGVVSELIAHFDGVKGNSRSITLAYLQSQSWLVRTRNAVLRLFSPYL